MSFGANQDSCWLQMMRKKHIIRYLKVNIISEVHIDQQRYVCWQGIGSNLQTNAELAMKKKKEKKEKIRQRGSFEAYSNVMAEGLHHQT